ncbi:5-hydroxyisourate hydrolase [Sphaerisporangium melleum]|uniref:5-hydroxyisourate hydrolase n=2 Tax=Sphaerisporangium melleum TaxID=321316 RepID=A0A917R4U9_9ACTN|nr:5-hydroxyisourate hydrolase [Sphaerisporangium melleum]GII72495.1 5-hydroxyisourate hydrolase [Sphaerisporangium melleum]
MRRARQMGVLEMSITAQALDSVYGRSAAGVRARLERDGLGGWHDLADAETDSEGRISEWRDKKLERGLYRIVFDSDYYFVGLGVSAAYPEIIVTFRMQDETDSYQIQVMLSPYSYSTHFRIA